MTTVLYLHLAVTLFMTGLIWFVQLVHYPLFACVGADDFRQYEREHVRRTTWIVAPAMLIEAATGLLLLLSPPKGITTLAPVCNMFLLIVLWLSTALLQVPCHRALADGFDGRAVSRLVASNWLRTVVWTARSVLVIVMAAVSQ